MNNMYASIFDGSPSVQKARDARDTAFQAMLNTRKQTAEQQRTDDVKMARWNALGNVLTTMVQPVGWAIGGGGFKEGGTGGVIKADDRQYISAFNRAVKDADDIRNIGLQDAEYQFKIANDEYTRALKLEDEERQTRRANEEYERRRKIIQQEEEEKEKARQERLQQEYELKTQLAQAQAAGRVAVENAKAANKNKSGTNKGGNGSGSNKPTFNVPGGHGSVVLER